MRSASQWWSQQRTRQLEQKAEEIREGLLQELFSCRRSLELHVRAHQGVSIENLEHCLSKLADLHYAVERLSYDLSPPYLEESLPLAVQHLLEQWREQRSKLSVELDLPSFWRGGLDCNRIVLAALDELLRLTLIENRREKVIHVGLQADGDMGELTVCITYCKPSELMAVSGGNRAKQLKYLSHSFQLLASGQSGGRRQGLRMTWYFRWRLH